MRGLKSLSWYLRGISTTWFLLCLENSTTWVLASLFFCPLGWSGLPKYTVWGVFCDPDSSEIEGFDMSFQLWDIQPKLLHQAVTGVSYLRGKGKPYTEPGWENTKMPLFFFLSLPLNFIECSCHPAISEEPHPCLLLQSSPYLCFLGYVP